jgi:DNA-binding beta-propeller fold protein YncE
MRLRVVCLPLSAAIALGCQSLSEPELSRLKERDRDADPSSSIEGVPGRPFGIRVAPNGVIFVTQQDRNSVTDVAPRDHGDRRVADVGVDPGDVIVTPDGRTVIVSTFYGGGLHFFDAASGHETGFTRIGNNAYRLALSASADAVFVTTTGGLVYAVAIATGEKSDSVHVGGSLQGIDRRNDGVLAVSSTSGAITLLDPITLDPLGSRVLPGVVQDVVFSRDGSELYVAVESGSDLLILDGHSLATRAVIAADDSAPAAPFGLALSPDGNRLAVSSSLTGSVAIINPTARQLLRVVRVHGIPRRLAFSPAGDRIYVANEADRVDVVR